MTISFPPRAYEDVAYRHALHPIGVRRRLNHLLSLKRPPYMNRPILAAAVTDSNPKMNGLRAQRM